MCFKKFARRTVRGVAPVRREMRPMSDKTASIQLASNRAAATNKSVIDRPIILAASVLLAAIIWIVFGRTTGHRFVNLDDQVAVFDNPHVTNGLSSQAIWWAFTHIDVNFYAPLTTISHMLDWTLYQSNAGGHHLTNILLHTASAILLFVILLQITFRFWRAAFVAVVFAIHPLHVESVAWVTERKDVLSGLFFMLTLLAYVHYTHRPRSLLRYAIVLLVFSLGLLSKPTLVTVPFVLLLLDYWPLKRFQQNGERQDDAGLNKQRPWSVFLRLLVEKIPLIALSAFASLVAFRAQGTAVMPVEKYSLFSRVGNAIISYFIYIKQTFLPTGLAAFYPHPGDDFSRHEAVIALILLGAISLAVFGVRRQPAILVGWLWYLGMLVPMIGIVQVGEFAHADRCMYLPQIGLAFAVAWLFPHICNWNSAFRSLPLIAGVLCITSLTISARSQAANWRDSEALWTHTIRCTPRNALAHNDLALALRDKGHTDEAVSHYNQALAIRPTYAEAHNNLAIILRQQGRVDEAITHFQEALANRPQYSEAHSNLGNALFAKGWLSEAEAEYRAALKDNPNLVAPHNNLALLLTQQGHAEEAIQHFRAAMEIDPSDPSAPNNLAWLLATHPKAVIRNGVEAITLAQRAITSSRGQNPATFDSLAAAYAETGRFAEAVTAAMHARELAAAKHDPDSVKGIDQRIRLYEDHSPYREVTNSQIQAEH